MDKALSNYIFTSGEAALSYLRKNLFSEKFFHIGPPRDFDLFSDFKKNKTIQFTNINWFIKKIIFNY